MTVAGLDFKNSVGMKTFSCFKKVCIIKRNTNESSSSDPTPKEAISKGIKRIRNPLARFNYKRMRILLVIPKPPLML